MVVGATVASSAGVRSELTITRPLVRAHWFKRGMISVSICSIDCFGNGGWVALEVTCLIPVISYIALFFFLFILLLVCYNDG